MKKSFEELIFDTDNLRLDTSKRNRTDNNLIYNSVFRLKAEQKVLDYMTGKAKMNLDIPNNIIQGNENAFQKTSLSINRMNSRLTDCFYRQYKFLNLVKRNKTMSDKYSQSIINGAVFKYGLIIFLPISIANVFAVLQQRLPRNQYYKVYIATAAIAFFSYKIALTIGKSISVNSDLQRTPQAS